MRHNQKLTDEDVGLIRQAGEERARLLAEARRLSNRALAAKFDVTKNYINRILQREVRP